MFTAEGTVNAEASKGKSGIFYKSKEAYMAPAKSARQRMRWMRKRPDCERLCRPR